jgi:hypothetical protein
MTMQRYVGIGLGGILALSALLGFAYAEAPAGVSGVAQYCAPAGDNPDALRFYCREEVSCSGPTDTATFACLA